MIFKSYLGSDKNKHAIIYLFIYLLTDRDLFIFFIFLFFYYYYYFICFVCAGFGSQGPFLLSQK